MPKAQYSITIHRPVSQVFAFMEDFQTDPLWRAHVLEMRITSAQRTGLGASHIEVREMFGKRLETPASIIGYEHNHRLEVQRASGPIRPIACYLYEASADSTRLTLMLSVPLHGAGTPADSTHCPPAWPDHAGRASRLCQTEGAPRTRRGTGASGQRRGVLNQPPI